MLSLLLTLCMLIGILPTAAFAADEDGISPASTGGGSWTDGSVISSPVTLDGTVPTVEVTGTVTVNATITVTGNVRITGGGTLLRDSSNTSNDMIVVSSGGTLTLDDITIDGNNVQATARGIRVASGGKLTINEGTIITHNTWKDETGCKGAALYVAGNAVMNGGRIEYNNSRNYGNVYISNSSTNPATFTMNGGIVSHNSLFHSDSDYGGGAFMCVMVCWKLTAALFLTTRALRLRAERFIVLLLVRYTLMVVQLRIIQLRTTKRAMRFFTAAKKIMAQNCISAVTL